MLRQKHTHFQILSTVYWQLQSVKGSSTLQCLLASPGIFISYSQFRHAFPAQRIKVQNEIGNCSEKVASIYVSVVRTQEWAPTVISPPAANPFRFFLATKVQFSLKCTCSSSEHFINTFSLVKAVLVLLKCAC